MVTIRSPLFHGWETGRVCFSESFESLSEGLQGALFELGGVPRRHRTDSLSAAMNSQVPDQISSRVVTDDVPNFTRRQRART